MSVCGTSVNHCIQLVGLNSVASPTPYWILRNQWGSGWGMSGFIWFKYGTNMCLMTSDPIYVTAKLVVATPTSKPTASPTSKPSSRTPTLKPSSTPTTRPSSTPTLPPTLAAPTFTAAPTPVDWFGANLVLPTSTPTSSPSYTSAPTANDLFQITCPAGSFVTGFYGFGGNWITALGISCGGTNVACAGAGATKLSAVCGATSSTKSATTATSTGSCSAGISSVTVSWGTYIGKLLPACTTGTSTALGLAAGAGSGSVQVYNCPSGQVITGISGRAGTSLTRLRFACSAMSSSTH